MQQRSPAFPLTSSPSSRYSSCPVSFANRPDPGEAMAATFLEGLRRSISCWACSPSPWLLETAFTKGLSASGMPWAVPAAAAAAAASIL